MTCSDGETTLEGTGSTEFELPYVGDWTVTASMGGANASQVVDVSGALLYEVDLMITSGIAVTVQPSKKTYYIGEAFDPAGMVVTATFADDTTENVTNDCTFSPVTIAKGTTAITVNYQRAGIKKTASVPVTVRVLSSIAITTAPAKTAYKYGEIFNPSGMVVTAHYTDGQSRTVTGYAFSPNTALGMSNTTITISYTEGDVTKTTTQAITVTTISTTLNSNSWATIKSVSDAGQGANYWAVGDTKRITLNGKVGAYTFSNFNIDVFILGFNHNSSKEGSNRIHFQIGKVSGKAVALCDSQYNGSGSSAMFHMNSSDSNSGGWNGSYMRKTLLGNSNTPDSTLENSLMAALPSDLLAVMKTVTKYTDNTGGGSNSSGNVTATADYLFLLAEFEVFGTRYWANQYEQNSQKQYDYYKAGNSRVAYNHSAVSTAVWWWLRSARYYTSYGFCDVNTDGRCGNYTANDSAGLRPGFAV